MSSRIARRSAACVGESATCLLIRFLLIIYESRGWAGGFQHNCFVRLSCRGSDGNIFACPLRKVGRLPASYIVCERNLTRRIRTEICMVRPVTEHLGNRGSSGERSHETVFFHLLV